MSHSTTAIEAISAIPGWRADDVFIEELKGGLTNRSFMVIRGADTFVLRLDAAHTAAFMLDRRRETAILRSAAQAGLAPEVVFADPEAGILLCAFLPGQVWSVNDLGDTANIESLCELLRKVHALPVSGNRFDASSAARRYAEKLQLRQELHSFALHCVDIVGSLPVAESMHCCHNDLIAQNIIATPELKLLDWEYACDNDPFFDLASLIGFHNLDQAAAERLLSAYTGGASAETRERLECQVRLYDAIQWLWLANRHLLSRNRQQAVRLENLQQRIR
ncbi:MAG: phosphotransferase family protein [Gammaproteobacteria bacterium]|nr:phosphotransferase family protein [Gammaproteobacteria bacterium]MDH4314614.1 phosphotransferase family protein [Gammaproteobacteria bacterium]MDH5212850.1 phosphotransferase family protein [Gammaproteobacteria bacterium]MDH5500314.1 phosphotransferase family protein [Gammaproteobacteria bacterium]